MFKRQSNNLLGPETEKEILVFWRENNVFAKSVEQRIGKEPFRFLEGPPTANGMPHHGHIRTRAVKDAILRYKTMCGYYVPRVAGWDTHGLPVELEVQSELGLKSKEDIEAFGLARFAEECKRNVFKYEEEWRRLTERIGFWIDLDNAYITLKNEYIESVWWSLKRLDEKGLLYKGFKVVPYCPRDETPLSSHEVAQGYDEAEDPSVYVKFRLVSGPHTGSNIVAWTTTPWTLPSNVGLAVNPDAEYVEFQQNGETLICSANRVKTVFGDTLIIKSFKGSELIGSNYEAPFDYLNSTEKKYVVVGYGGVSLDDGTGVLHLAPAFGEEDYEVCKQNGLAFFQPVDSKGRFTAEVQNLKGVFVKDADKTIITQLKKKGALVKSERIKHTYPFCWRCGSPLLYYAWPTWFVKTTAEKEEIIEHNNAVKWYPSHIREGRFGEFLKEMVDWALSRNRYWGTPLPVWICSKCEKKLVVGSIKQLLENSVRKPQKIELHRPYVDEFVLKCENCGGEMQRVKEVIDVWYDSGSATFASHHYPFENADEFKANFPIDFITEGVDQTRGWFYSLHVLGSLLFNERAFKNCLVMGLVLNEKGEKMAKSEKNYVDPWLLLDKYGADPFRWHLLGATPCWEPIKFGETGVADSQRRFFNILENSVVFLLTYAEIDGFDYKVHRVAEERRHTLDKWLLSKLTLLIKSVRGAFDAYELNKAVTSIERFVIEDLSQWFIRRSRRRFWKEEKDDEKWSAYTTLYETLMDLSKLLAPIAPFSSEKVYSVLSKTSTQPISVHLCDYPSSNERFLNRESLDEVESIRLVVETIRAARSAAGVKTRQPLTEALIFCSDTVWLAVKRNMELILDEVNVKEVKRMESLTGYITYDLKPNLANIGKRFRNKSKMLIEAAEKNKREVAQSLAESGSAVLVVDGSKDVVTIEDFGVIVGSKTGFSHSEKEGLHVFLNLAIDPVLEEEWLVREMVRRIQLTRKELNLRFDEKIGLTVWSEEHKVLQAVNRFAEYIAKETLASEVVVSQDAKEASKWQIDEFEVWLKIKRFSKAGETPDQL
jgi:isoleucyl-tRNA synthetase